MSAVILPELRWEATSACSPRYGHKVSLVVVHRWGVRFTTPAAEALSYQGVIAEFRDPANRASAHVVYPGSAVPGEATQMVHWSDLAWTEAAYNPVADDVESADHIWVKGPDGLYDEAGFAQLARIVAFRCHARSIPPVWSTRHGVCRHADLGAAGGDHPQCPTTDLARWRKFIGLVEREYHRGGFRSVWGR